MYAFICRARFTQVWNLQRHAKTCAQEVTIIGCPNKQVKVPQRVYERAFYAKNKASPAALGLSERAGVSENI